ncbi:putative tricarboxylic transport membrane protein [Anoxybacillus vitaminiphilus]|uniref:Putative tricarboxylic transport membrane protein n=1 Tax=Paranoxybacillus vitaminiphilus TaxID=581036 RepID=A0A327YHN6_9BACL|nr:tripartite tricarboxylate transporter TctB family protein [Anoxybacillus vitaminiphilus]RAK20520.1 putative tricarboxylic transport membrane protein [Anoxybacillus vitaminiphilus]
MLSKNMWSDRIGGFISIIFGIVAIAEAVRLYPNRIDLFVGDHTMPGLIGGVMIFLGFLMFFVKGERFTVEFADRKTMIKILLTIGLLFAYWILLQILGYLISTLVISMFLFKVLGSYSFYKSVVFAVVLTVLLYVLFILWLSIPFPTGILGI